MADDTEAVTLKGDEILQVIINNIMTLYVIIFLIETPKRC